jgi:hypothetical protein
MDSNINNEKHGMQQDPLSWDEMKDGIFGKVLENDPEYFTTPKKKRRGLLILLPVAAALLIVALYALSGVTVSPGTTTQDGTADNVSELNETNEQAESATRSFGSSRESDPAAIDEPNVQVIAEQTRTTSTIVDTGTIPNNRTTTANEPENDRSSTSTTDDTDNSMLKEAALSDKAQRKLETPQGQPSRMKFQPLAPLDRIQSRSGLSHAHTYNGMTTHDLPVILPDLTEDRDTKTCPWELNASAGGLFSSTPLSGKSRSVTLRNDHSSALFGFTGSISANYRIARSTNLHVGLSYAQAYQNIDIATEREIEVTETEALLHVRHFVVGSRRIETYGDTIVNAIEKNRLAYTNTFRWLHLSLGAGHTFELNKWHLSPSIGASLGKLWSEGYTVAADGQILKYDKANPVYAQHSFKVWVALALTRQLNDRMAFNIAYRIDKQLNNASLESDVVFKPVLHQLEVGLALRFGCK